MALSIYKSLLFPNYFTIPFPGTMDYFPSSNIQLCINSTRNNNAFSSPCVSFYNPPPSINLDYLESEFGGHGVTFEDINDTSSSSSSCVLKMSLDDASVATLMLPSGLITSYKAPMWHGGTLELLHTCVSESEHVSIRGGLSLAFTCQTHDVQGVGVSWSPDTWTLVTVKGDSQQLIQVELVSSSNVADMMIQVKHVLTLRQGLLSSKVIISNLGSSLISVVGCLLSHLNVSTPEATYAVGLEGSDFYSKTPIASDFSIIPPPRQPFTAINDSNSTQFWGPISQLFSMPGEKEGVTEEAEGEERDNYKHLADSMSRIYTSAPRCFTLIDRGKRNSVEVESTGFNEMYMYSPGSTHKWYGKYAYICVGQSSLLKPILMAPGGEWRGSQHLRNPNF